MKFYLKKSSSISFRHNQPSKSLRSRRKRPNFIGAQETFIDGPTCGISGISGLEFGAAIPESTSGSGTSSENTFGTSPSELSMTTTETTTTTTTTTSTDSDCDHKCQGKYVIPDVLLKELRFSNDNANFEILKKI